MHAKITIFTFILCLSLIGCSLVPNEIKTAEKIMDTNPDSALHILLQINNSQSITYADRALFGILLFQALDKNEKTLQPDSAISFSIKYYSNKNDKAHLAIAYFYKARLYKRAQRFDDATMLYLKALDLIQNKENLILLGKIYSDMGDICLIQKDYNESLLKHQKAIELFEQAGDTTEACYKIIDVGRVYRFLKDYKKAYINYKSALAQSSDSLLQGTAYQEIGINYYNAKQYDSAQYFLRKSLIFPYKGNSFAIRCSILADLYFDLNKYDSASTYANKALTFPTTFFNQRDCYRILANTEYKRGNFKQMAEYMTKYQACTDSVRKVEIQTKTTVLEDLHQTSGAFSKSKEFLKILAFVILIIVIISLIIVFQLRKKSKKKEIELERVEIKLSHKQTLLRDSFIQKIQDNKISHSEAYRKASLKDREKLDVEIYNISLHLNNWIEFKKSMNQTFNGLLDYLENNYDDINQKELTWCCLYLLNVPTNDMTSILNCQQGSLYKLKHRLTQKLTLSSTKELEQFLLARSEAN